MHGTLGSVTSYNLWGSHHPRLASLFYYKKGLVTIYLIVYADDIIVASSSPSTAADLL
jgi:hypothetical protein